VQTQVILGIDLWALQPKAGLHAVCLPIRSDTAAHTCRESQILT